MDQALADGWDLRTKRDMKTMYREGGTAGAHLTFSSFITLGGAQAAEDLDAKPGFTKAEALTVTVSWSQNQQM